MANVRFAIDWKSEGGRSYRAGTVTDLNDDDARSLATRGILQVVATPAAAEDPAKSPDKAK